ncbi:MAG: CPBP family intramembrane glutamic endopeptidase [Armatimonadota bacterium]
MNLMQAMPILLYIVLTLAYVSFIIVNHKRISAGRPPIRALIWSYTDAWPMVHGVAIVSVLGTLTAATFGSEKHVSGHMDFLSVMLPSAFMQNAGMVIVVLLFVCSLYRISGKQLGFTFDARQLLKGMAIGVPTFLAVALIAITLMAVLHGLFGAAAVNKLVDVSNRLNGANQIMGDLKTNKELLGFIIMASVLAPIGEEFFFRGWLFNMIKIRTARLGLAIWGSAVLFALIHVAPLSIMMIIPLGAWLAWSYHISGSIWKNIGIHSSYNLVMCIIYIVAKSHGVDIDKVI